MKIECTVKELKEMLLNKTPVAGTTDAKIEIDGKEISCAFLKYCNSRRANYDKHLTNLR